MRVLLVVHGFPPAAAGGTEIYTRTLAHALAAGGDEVFVLAREANPCRPEYGLRRGADGAVQVSWVNNTFRACTSFEDSYANPALLAAADLEIERIDPDVVHIQHLTCLSTGIPGALSRRRIPAVMTLNDYWLICHRGQLLTCRGDRCDGPFEGGCAGCVPAAGLVSAGVARVGRTVGTLPGAAAAVAAGVRLLGTVRPDKRARAASAARLEHMRNSVRPVEVFLAPSDTIAGMFGRFGLPPGRLRRCDQGVALHQFQSTPRSPSPALRVGFAGTLIPSKAPHLLLEAVQALPPGSVTLQMLGEVAAYHGDLSYGRRLEPLLTQPFVGRAGPVHHAQMPAALATLDLLVVPSVWIENAPFVIREAFAAGLPVLASDLGGMAEMVRHEVDGLLFAPGDAAALALHLKRLLDDPTLLPRLRAGIRRPASIDEDAAALKQLYGELAPRPHGPRSVTAAYEDAPPAVCAVVINYCTPDQTWLAVRSLQTSRCPPRSILVVDNGSPDGSAGWLRKALPGVEVIETGANLGFSGGCNAGISRALAGGAGFVLLVNSDVVLHPDATGQLLEAARRHSRAGILAPVLRSREDPDRVVSAGIRFSSRTGRMMHRTYGGRAGQLIAGGVTGVEAVSGCVMLVRAELFRAVGSLDEDYFFSFEDLDLCLRARTAGFRVVLVTDAAAYHQGGHTIGSRSPRRVYFATRNHLRLDSRARPSSGSLTAVLRGAFIVGLNAAYAVTSPDAPALRGLAAVARGTWHHIIGRYGPA